MMLSHVAAHLSNSLLRFNYKVVSEEASDPQPPDGTRSAEHAAATLLRLRIVDNLYRRRGEESPGHRQIVSVLLAKTR